MQNRFNKNKNYNCNYRAKARRRKADFAGADKKRNFIGFAPLRDNTLYESHASMQTSKTKKGSHNITVREACKIVSAKIKIIIVIIAQRCEGAKLILPELIEKGVLSASRGNTLIN